MPKKIATLLLVMSFLLSMLPVNAAAKKEENNSACEELTLGLICDHSDLEEIHGFFDGEHFFITIDEACELADVTIDAYNGNTYKVFADDPPRNFDIQANKQRILEQYTRNDVSSDIQTQKFDNKWYISALDFLNYTGMEVLIDPSNMPTLIVVNRYDIFDALTDFSQSETGKLFWWDQLEAEGSSMEDKLLNAGIVAMINRSPNILDMILFPKQTEQKAIEDALVSILLNEGQDYVNEEDFPDEILNFCELISMSEPLLEQMDKVNFWGMQDIWSDASDVVSRNSDLIDVSSKALDIAKTAQRYHCIEDSEKNLLKNTILHNPMGSTMLKDDWKIILNASRAVDNRIYEQWSGAFEEGAIGFLEFTCDKYEEMAEAELMSLGNGPGVVFLWNSVIKFEQKFPFTRNIINNKDALFQSYLCSIIQLVAHDLLITEYQYWSQQEFFYADPERFEETAERIKQLVELRIKSTMTTRAYLLDSHYLAEDLIEDFKEENKRDALFLMKLEQTSVRFPCNKTNEYHVELLKGIAKNPPKMNPAIPKDAGRLNRHSYYVYHRDADITWNEALDYCEKQGGHLAVITSQEEDSFLYSYVRRQGYKSAYFGLYEPDGNDQWQWVTGEDFQYSNWAPNEPNHQGGYEHYGMYYKAYRDFEKGLWNDGKKYCDTFICEWESDIMPSAQDEADKKNTEPVSTSALLGQWFRKDNSYVAIFNKDGTCQAPFTFNGGWIESANRYVVDENDTLIFASPAGHAGRTYQRVDTKRKAFKVDGYYYLDQDVLVIGCYEYTRLAANDGEEAQLANANIQEALIGQWLCSQNHEIVILNQDGTCQAPFTYNGAWIESADHYALGKDGMLVFSSTYGHAGGSFSKAETMEQAKASSSYYYLDKDIFIINLETYHRIS